MSSLVQRLATLSDGDKYLETSDVITWDIDGAVKIRYGDADLKALPAMTVMSFLRATAQAFPNHPALGRHTVSLC